MIELSHFVTLPPMNSSTLGDMSARPRTVTTSSRLSYFTHWRRWLSQQRGRVFVCRSRHLGSIPGWGRRDFFTLQLALFLFSYWVIFRNEVKSVTVTQKSMWHSATPRWIHLTNLDYIVGTLQQTYSRDSKPQIIQVAQWATIDHLGASIMFGDTIIYNAQRQVNLNLKQWPGINLKKHKILC